MRTLKIGNWVMIGLSLANLTIGIVNGNLTAVCGWGCSAIGWFLLAENY